MTDIKRFSELYQEYAEEITDSPTIFHRFVAHWILSCAVGQNIYLQQGFSNIYPNIWLVLLAPSSLYHKSYSLSIGRDILERVVPDFVYPNEFSAEKLIEILERQPSGTFIYDEFASFLSHVGRDYAAGVKPLLTSIYGGETYRRVVGMDKEKVSVVKDTFVNFAAASTLFWLREQVKAGDMAGGFLPRFLLVTETRREKCLAFQPPCDEGKRNQLVSLLGTLRTEHGPATYDADAKTEFEKFYRNFIAQAEAKDEKIQPFLARLLPYVHKLALLTSVDRREYPRITKPALVEAKLLVEDLAIRLETSVIRDLGATRFQQTAIKVADFIRGRNGEGVPRSDILNRLHLPAKVLDDVRRTLVEAGQVEIREEDTGGKRALEKWFWNHEKMGGKT